MMQRQAVLAPGGNRHHSAEHWHLNRQFLLGGGAVAELPLVVPAPSTHGTVCPQSQAMRPTRGDGDDAIEVMDQSRCWPRLDGPVSELASGVETPCPDIAANIEREDMGDTRRDRHDVIKPFDFNRLLSRLFRAVP